MAGIEFMQPSRQPVRLLRYLPIQNVKDALRPKGPAVRSPGREAGGIGVISMSAEGAAQWECRALRPWRNPYLLARGVSRITFSCAWVCAAHVRLRSDFLVAARLHCVHRWFHFYAV